ncbi:hypothetical protein DL93DRAFT_2223381 [Clavulina sp. PMI_390]|nr:hypothetical protein DL93DRAFT_2223381 [Clavulina sp. PMI_390]
MIKPVHDLSSSTNDPVSIETNELVARSPSPLSPKPLDGPSAPAHHTTAESMSFGDYLRLRRPSGHEPVITQHEPLEGLAHHSLAGPISSPTTSLISSPTSSSFVEVDHDDGKAFPPVGHVADGPPAAIDAHLMTLPLADSPPTVTDSMSGIVSHLQELRFQLHSPAVKPDIESFVALKAAIRPEASESLHLSNRSNIETHSPLDGLAISSNSSQTSLTFEEGSDSISLCTSECSSDYPFPTESQFSPSESGDSNSPMPPFPDSESVKTPTSHLPPTDTFSTPAAQGTDIQAQSRQPPQEQERHSVLKEQQLFEELGYLPPARPPNEAQRLAALHRFHVLYTDPDPNFDRVALLARSVFNTKWALISLIDSDKQHVPSIQFLKHDSGLSWSVGDRSASFCGHTILSDRPMVVLNAHEDWRFAGNPFVVNAPGDPENCADLNIGFYAGAPLRTDGGLNLGTICVIDDNPRELFGPEDAQILEEFATIVVRELELWRDSVLLARRDRIQLSMEHFSRECLALAPEIDMSVVYQQAADLITATLGLDGSVIIDLSGFAAAPSALERHDASMITSSNRGHSRGLAITSSSSGNHPKMAVEHDPSHMLAPEQLHSPVNAHYQHPRPLDPSQTSAPLSVLAYSMHDNTQLRHDNGLSPWDRANLIHFLADHPDGTSFQHEVPAYFRSLTPEKLESAMIVPVFNVDGQPFILLSGFVSEGSKALLEGYEIQYLRGIGVIILSAALKRRIRLADEAKSLFISNISHELRTPLHGILAAAELLGDSKLTPNQQSFLHTVEACGTSLVETVNHVLDFSKLATMSKMPAMKRSSADLLSLLEDTVEGGWIGAHARSVWGTADIGSAYSPPSAQTGTDAQNSVRQAQKMLNVETVLDIGYRAQGWLFRCEKGGIRRVLMNLMGNSLKFTDVSTTKTVIIKSDLKTNMGFSKAGFVHIKLTELPMVTMGGESGTQRLQLAVVDSGKGMSKDFLQNQLFQPFSQENPSHAGTGLGLAIVNSIVKSEGLNGKVEVFSTEGAGTEIRMTFEVEPVSQRSSSRRGSGQDPIYQGHLQGARIWMAGFDDNHKGQKLLHDVLSGYITTWWSAQVSLDRNDANVVIINDQQDVLMDLIQVEDVGQPIIFLTADRGSPQISALIYAYEQLGGRCYMAYKPCRPTSLYSTLQKALFTPRIPPESQILRRRSGSLLTSSLIETLAPRPPPIIRRQTEAKVSLHPRASIDFGDVRSQLPPRSRSETTIVPFPSASSSSWRPSMGRSLTDQPASPSRWSSLRHIRSSSISGEPLKPRLKRRPNLRSSQHFRVLVVEDNHVNRALLIQWLKKKGYAYEEAVDGQQAADIVKDRPPGHFEIILMDISMPVLDGIGATKLIRQIESSRAKQESEDWFDAEDDSESWPVQDRAKIFAVSGLATKEDKVRAFVAGMDGYLVKPVSFKALADLFSRLTSAHGSGNTSA